MLSYFGMFLLMMAVASIKTIERRYYRNGENDLSVEELLSRASLDDIVRFRFYVIQVWIGLGFASIGSVLKVF
jgi:hypothetical protein